MHFNAREVRFIVSLIIFLSKENLEQTLVDLLTVEFPANPKMFWAFVCVMLRKAQTDIEIGAAWDKVMRAKTTHNLPSEVSPFTGIEFNKFFISYLEMSSTSTLALSEELNRIYAEIS